MLGKTIITYGHDVKMKRVRAASSFHNENSFVYILIITLFLYKTLAFLLPYVILYLNNQSIISEELVNIYEDRTSA